MVGYYENVLQEIATIGFSGARADQPVERGHNQSNSTSRNDCGFGQFYGAINAREKNFASCGEADDYGETEPNDNEEYEEVSEDDAYEEEMRQKLDNKPKSISPHYTEDSYDEEDEDETSGTDYPVRGKQMRAFTQEPDLGRDTGTYVDEEDYNAEPGRQNAIVDDDSDSDEDDILYQGRGVIPAQSVATHPIALPPKSLVYQRQPLNHLPLSKLQVLKPTPNPQPVNRSTTFRSERDVLAQFSQDPGPRTVEYVSRQEAADDFCIDPKWRTPALSAVTPDKRLIPKSITLQLEPKRSPSPQGDSIWAPEKKRRSRCKADPREQKVLPQTETVVLDLTIIDEEVITRSREAAQKMRYGPERSEAAAQNNIFHQNLQYENALIAAPQDLRQKSLVSETANKTGDDDELPAFVSELKYGLKNNGSASDYAPQTTAQDTALKRRTQSKTYVKGRARRKPGSLFKPRPGRRTYTEEDDKQMLEWVEWVRNETKYPIWSAGHWEMLSKKNPRHTGKAWTQHYRIYCQLNGDQHLFPRIMMAEREGAAPRTTVGDGAVNGTPGLDKPAESVPTGYVPEEGQQAKDQPVGQHLSVPTGVTRSGVSETSKAQPGPQVSSKALSDTPRLDGAAADRPNQASLEVSGALVKSARVRLWESVRHIIYRLYIEEDYTLKSVMKLMAEQHGLVAHVSQFKTYLNKWGYKKNRMNGEEGFPVPVLRSTKGLPNGCQDTNGGMSRSIEGPLV